MTDIDEQQPDAVLKGAEYVEYLGLYFNREKEASAAIQHIVDNYMCTQKAVEGVVQENDPVPVLWAQYWSGATCSDGSSGGSPRRRSWPPSCSSHSRASTSSTQTKLRPPLPRSVCVCL